MVTKLTVSIVVNAPIEKVWNVFWNPIHIVHWCFASDDWCCPWARGEAPKVGDIFTTRMEARNGSFGFDLTAQYTKVEELKTIEYTLGEIKEYFVDAGRVVNVNFEVVPLGPVPLVVKKAISEGQEDLNSLDKELVLNLIAEGKQLKEAGEFGVKITETFDAEDVHSTEQQIAGWQAILENFKKYVESL